MLGCVCVCVYEVYLILCSVCMQCGMFALHISCSRNVYGHSKLNPHLLPCWCLPYLDPQQILCSHLQEAGTLWISAHIPASLWFIWVCWGLSLRHLQVNRRLSIHEAQDLVLLLWASGLAAEPSHPQLWAGTISCTLYYHRTAAAAAVPRTIHVPVLMAALFPPIALTLEPSSMPAVVHLSGGSAVL